MDLNDYFDPLELADITLPDFYDDKLFSQVQFYTKTKAINNISDSQIALISISDNEEEILGNNKIREKLFSLSQIRKPISIYDLGNIKLGKTKKDRYVAVRDVAIELLKDNVLPILLCKNKDYHYAIYQAYAKLGKNINLTGIDSKIELRSNLLNEILIKDNNFLFTYNNIGFQQYFVNDKTLLELSKHNHETCRLGDIRSDVKIVEPILRDTNSLFVSLSSIKQSESPGNIEASPNGFYGEEICQLLKYGGISDKISSLAIYGYLLSKDRDNQTSHLIAQMLWYFLDGFTNRKYEFPNKEKGAYKKFIVNIDSSNKEIIFYKSENTDRWWVEIPYIASNGEKVYLVPCNYSDYKKACNNEIPSIWLKVYKKIN
ncbi:MAG: hypothetical protein U9R54_06865 [Bacteroidota bacterium]|nr:hypothetical protein [Bacteroidota bacterium]